jgi:hypothetical protein
MALFPFRGKKVVAFFVLPQLLLVIHQPSLLLYQDENKPEEKN